MITKRILIAAIGLGLNCIGAAAGQACPNNSIKIISNNAAGGPNDVLARLVAEGLSASLRRPVIVENRPGAGTTIGSKAAATAMPDGCTLLFVTPSLAISSALYKDPGYDPVKSFAPIATVSTTPWVLVVTPSTPAKSIQELIAYAKSNPGKLNYGAGIGTPPHLLGEMFKAKIGTDIVYVPYKGAAPVITDLLDGQIQMAIENISGLLPYIRKGALRPLAVTSLTRRPELLDVPTFVESGIVGLPTGTWTGVVAPAGTPQEIIDKLNSAINASLASAEMQARLAQRGVSARIGSPGDFARLIADETPKWVAMVKSSGMRID